MALIQCICTGASDLPAAPPCPADATQEDFLCDHCRTVDCPSLTMAELADWTLCHRLGCPEHAVPGSRPVETAVF